ncbi:hypothetical protein C8Q76DRAFT_633856, partial [Earliella scabrosa]
MISSFIDIILRYGRSGRGLLGKCSAYYGTVEAQGRGTLHCHLLIWIEGHPSPQKMRDMMIDNEQYQQDVFRWLESLVKCELLGTEEVVNEQDGEPLRRPRYSENDGYIHPGMRPSPSIADIPATVFQAHYTSFVNELVEQYNWHEHTETCWKYLRRDEARTDATCRMRIDGSVRYLTVIDDETGSILLRRLHPRIANYNDLVIFLMKANMDIKHIGSGEGAKALIYYITDYITKSSLPTHLGLAALMYAITRTGQKYKDIQEWGQKEDSGALTMLINSMLARMEVSHPQVMSYLVGGGDRYTSHRFRILHYGAFERQVLRHWESEATPADDLQSDADDDLDDTEGDSEDVGDLGLSPSNDNTEPRVDGSDVEEETVTLTLGAGSISAVCQQQDYMYRPSNIAFESMSLYEFVGKTEKIALTTEQARL